MPLSFDLKIIDKAIGIYNCPPDWHVNETGGLYHRIYYGYEGKAYFEDDSNCFNLMLGTLYIFPINKAYKITHDPKNPYKCLYFHININPIILNPVIGYKIETNQTAVQLIKAFECEIGEGNGLQDESGLLHHLLYSLLILVNQEVEFLYLNDSNLFKVMDYIHNNFMENITNETLSRLSGYDKSYFIRLFKKTFGITPQKYISNYRFNKAEIFLMENIPVSEVSQRVGFNDAKAFSRAFKKSKNIAPSQFKESHFLQP
jgi:AraC-like DNA-binding protein